MSRPTDLPEAISSRYRVEKELGRGGMGRVVGAYDQTIRRRVAIKIVPAPPPGDAEQQLAFERFRREAQFAGGLKHDNIVGIHDFGANDAAAWMVMEIVEGGSLRDLLRRTEPFSLAETVRIVVQLLDGLAFCHDQGIAHCDVKPANIMLKEPSTAGEVKLADFGIAHYFGPEQEDPEATRVVVGNGSAETVRLGTPAYMAPEQFTGAHLDARTDIWAAGVVLYQLLTRENPFKGSIAEIEAKVLGSEPIPPSQLSVLANSAIDNVVRKALSKRPEDRFQDARSFSAALLEAERARRGSAGTTAVVPPPLKPSVLTPSPSKTPGWVKLAAGGGLALAAAGAIAFFTLSDSSPRRETPERTIVAQPAPPQPQPQPQPPVLAPAAPPARSEPPVPAVPSAPPRSTAAAPPLLVPTPAPLLVPAPAPSSTAQPAPALTPVPMPAMPATPDPPPAVPTAEVRERRLAEALREVSARPICGVIEPQGEGNGITVGGFVHQRQLGTLREALAATGFPSRIDADIFDAPYCGVLSALRPVMAEARGLPSMAPRERQIRDGSRLTLDLGMPAWPATINVWFVMHDGQTLHLLRDLPLAPGERRTFNESRPDFPWTISEPYGHELVVLLASDGPLFASAPPFEENIEALTQHLQAALQRAQGQRRRVLARAILVETKP